MTPSRLSCYQLRYTVKGGDFDGECGWACVIDSNEDEARRTVVSHFDCFGGDVTIGWVRRCSLVEGAYQLLKDGQQPVIGHDVH